VPKGCERRLRATLISNKVVEDVVGFGDGEFLTDLSLTLVNSLKTLASEHINLLCRKICLKTNNIIGYLSNAMDRVMVDLFAHVGKM